MIGNLFLVIINHDYQIVNVFSGGKHQCFPILSLLKLTVTSQNKNQFVIVIVFFGDSRADSDREPLSERARSDTQTW